MTKDEKYNRSEKGKARYARYRSIHWKRVEAARLRWNAARRQRSLHERIHTQD